MEKTRPLRERVKDHVDESGLSLEDLAEKTGWSEQRVYRLLVGKTQWRAEDMETLARVLNKSVTSLYRGKAKSS